MNWYKKARKLDWNKTYDNLRKRWGRNPTAREVQEKLMPDALEENNNIQDSNNINQNDNDAEEEVSWKKKRKKQPQLQPI